MNTEETTNTLLKELIALDPTFAEKEGELRVLIAHLTGKKPAVIIDDIFVHDLRERLVRSHAFPIRSPYQKMNWWAVHLAPVGALAILLLVLMPNGLRYFDEQNVSTEPTNLEESFQMNVADDASFRNSSPSAKSIPEAANDTADMSSITAQGGDTVLLSPNHFLLKMQRPGVSVIIESVTLTQPGFVIIHTFGQQGIGPVVGVSPLQNGGTTVGVPIYLRNVTHHGETYYAALYHDSGNGVFSQSDDIPVIDPILGTPFSVLFTIGIPETR
jgi:hypothetical protein